MPRNIRELDTALHSPLWISHRGLSIGCDENSRESFDAAVESGFTHIETDLRVCGTGEIVLCHDDDLTRISGDALSIRRTSRSKLEKVRLRHGGKLMFFDEFVALYDSINWTFDIKAETGHLVVSKLLGWAYKHRSYAWLTQKVKFLFWNALHQRQLLLEIPRASLYARRSQCVLAGLQVLLLNGKGPWLREGLTYALPPKFLGKDCFQERFVKRYHAEDAKVIAYLPETDQLTRQALAIGVDEILTNGKRLD